MQRSFISLMCCRSGCAQNQHHLFYTFNIFVIFVFLANKITVSFTLKIKSKFFLFFNFSAFDYNYHLYSEWYFPVSMHVLAKGKANWVSIVGPFMVQVLVQCVNKQSGTIQHCSMLAKTLHLYWPKLSRCAYVGPTWFKLRVLVIFNSLEKLDSAFFLLLLIINSKSSSRIGIPLGVHTVYQKNSITYRCWGSLGMPTMMCVCVTNNVYQQCLPIRQRLANNWFLSVRIISFL